MIREDAHSYVVDEEVVGREDDKNSIIKLLLKTNFEEKNVYVVAIVGIGGLGKTTLTKYVFNDKILK